MGRTGGTRSLAARGGGVARAGGAADVGVEARRAEAPQVGRAAVAREAQRVRRLPDLLDAHRADVPAGVRIRGQRRAAFDRPVGLDAEAGVAGGAALPVPRL